MPSDRVIAEAVVAPVATTMVTLPNAAVCSSRYSRHAQGAASVVALQDNINQLRQSHPVAQVHSEVRHGKINLRQDRLLMFNAESQLAQVLLDIAIS